MTNKEKQKEIAIQSQYLSDFPHDRASAEHAALKMAEWKDQQFKEYLERKKASLSVRSDLIGLDAPSHAKLINEIINEFFKEE